MIIPQGVLLFNQTHKGGIMLPIGTQIKSIRKQKNVSLTELAESSGVQIATLSRIEHGRMTGTIESHLAISKALDIDITDLYLGIQDNIPSPIKANDSLEAMQSPNPNISKEILARNVSQKKMLPTIICLEPNTKTNKDNAKPGSEAFVFMLDGLITLKVSNQEIKLDKNSSIYFNPAQPYVIENTSQAKPAKLLLILTPVQL